MNNVPLGTVILSLESGARPKGGVSADSGEIPSIGGEHLTDDGNFDFSSIKRIPISFFKKMKSGHVCPLDILIVKDGATTGKTSFVHPAFPFREVAVNEHVFCVRVNPEKAVPAYICHFLRSAEGKKAILRDFRGATIGGISREFASKVILPLPSLPEQQRIVDILDRAEALRAKRREALAQLDELTQSIYLDMFGDAVSNPKGWERSSLKHCVNQIQIGPFGSLLHKEDYIFDGIPLINPTHIEDGKIVPGLNQSITVQKLAELQLYQLQKGDVIMGRRGEMGRCAIVEPKHNGMLCGTGSLFIRPDESKAIAVYLQATLSSASMRKHLEGFSLGVTLQNLNRGIVGELTISLPPIEMQKEFCHSIESVEILKATYKSSLSELEELFLSLQYRAFKGEL